MQYRKLGKTGIKVSALGFGCMRLPILDNDSAKINEKEAIKMIRYAIDKGVNYIDTAYPYHGGNSELLVAKSLKDGCRERVKLATKLPTWLCNSYEDFDKLLNEQLKKLETKYIDFYLIHGLDALSWKKVKGLKILNFLDKAIKDGKIKYAGFSFHDVFPVFKDIIDSYNWALCQIQLCFTDEQHQAGIKGLRYAASKNIAVVVMTPLNGGKLAKDIPEQVKTIYDNFKIKRTQVAWAFKWVYNHPEVSVVLSGMSDMQQVIENVKIAETALPNSLANEELNILEKIKTIYKQRLKINCTECGYCMPCPSNVNIPRIFSIYNDMFIYNAKEEAIKKYNNILVSKEQDASKCTECGKCEEKCPQHLTIIKNLKEVHKELRKID